LYRKTSIDEFLENSNSTSRRIKWKPRVSVTISMFDIGFAPPTTVPGLVVLAVALIAIWIAVSIPVYVSGELITHGRASLGSAMGATLGGWVAYFIVLYGAAIVFAPYLGASALLISLVLALVAWLAVYRASFETSWTGALGIVVVGWVVLIAMNAILISFFGVALPRFNPF